MPKTRISEYSATNSSNTDIEGINIDEGCAPSGINNAIRELMVHLKEFQTGASGDAFTFAGGTLMSGTNTISGAAIISGNINSSGTNTFSGSNVMSFSGGSSASPSIYFASDTNTGIFSPAADTIAFTEGGAESMRIDSSGNVGIGTISPGFRLDVAGGGGRIIPSGGSANTQESGAGTLNVYGATSAITTRTGALRLESYSDMAANVGTGISFSGRFNTAPSDSSYTFAKIGGYKENATTNNGAGYLAFAISTGPGDLTERMRINSSGNVGIGTTSPICRLDVREANRANSTNIANTGIYTTDSPAIDFGGSIALGGRFNSGSQSEAPFGSIRGGKENSTNNNYAGYLSFQTIQDSAALVERARITSGGDLLVGTTSNTYSSKIVSSNGITDFGSQYNTARAGAPYEFVNRTASYGFSFYVNAATVVASLSSSGVWTDASDARYKENIENSEYGLQEVLQLTPRTYNIIGNDKKQVGFIAQEVIGIVPELVDSINNSVTQEDRYTLSYGQMSAVLVKAIQELKTELDTANTRLAALENK